MVPVLKGEISLTDILGGSMHRDCEWLNIKRGDRGGKF